MEYIEAPKESASVSNPFAVLHLDPDDRRNLILIRGRHLYVLMNRFPYNAGHLMVVPYEEIPDLEGLCEEAQLEFLQLVMRSKSMLSKALKPDGFNIGINLGSAAGAGIPWHLHCHIVPRWNGDTNFMPVIGKTRVLPTALDVLWERLKAFAD
jgi:ATP adenylyltransferase